MSGAPNSVMGISGSGVVGELIGITAPGGTIGPGTYDVIEDANQDGIFNGPDSVLFDAFTVVIPPDLPPLPSASFAAMKARAAAAEQHWKDVHDAYKKLFMISDILDIHGALTDPADGFLWGLQWIGGKTKLLFDVKGGTLQTILSVAAHHKGIAADPPDPNFDQPTVLSARQTFDLRTDDPLLIAMEDLANSLGDEAVIAEALLASIERYQGADIAENGEWGLAQARFARDYALLLSEQAADTNAALANFASALSADSRDFNTTGSFMESLKSSLLTTGLTADQRRDLQNLGLSDEEIDELGAFLVDTDFDFDKTAALSELTATQATYSGMATAAADFADALDDLVLALEADLTVSDLVPVADAGGPYAGNEGTTINFDGSGSTASPDGAAITTYEWDTDGDGLFDDAVGVTASAAYSEAFNGFVGLRVIDAGGFSSVDYAQLHVNNVNSPASIDSRTPTSSNVIIPVGSTESFSVTVSDPDGDGVTVDWLLDGIPLATGLSASYTPSLADTGLHGISSTATDDSGIGGSETVFWVLEVVAPDSDGDTWTANIDCDEANPAVHPGQLDIPNNGIDDDCDPATLDTGLIPLADFTTDPVYGTPGVSLQFLDTTTDEDSAIVAWEWDFDLDGITDSTEQNPTSTFATKGVFDVELTVTDEHGNEDTVVKPVFILVAPAASFTVSPAPYLALLPVSFTDTSTDSDGTVVAWMWDFGDGASSTAQQPVHAYDDNGTFTVTLTVQDNEGATDTTSQTITVLLNRQVVAGPDRAIDEGISASFTLSPGAVPVTVPESQLAQFTRFIFADSQFTSGHTATVDWDDGSGPQPATVGYTSPGQGFVTSSHLYPDDGVFVVEVCVTATDASVVCDQLVLTVNNRAPTTSLFDLRSWTPESYAPVSGFPPGDWRVAEDGRTVVQINNGQPTYFASDFNVFESQSSVRMRVSGGDDDMIGFALGFAPGDTTNPDADYILLDWKGGTQNFNFGGGTANCTGSTTAQAGLAVSRVTGIPTADELWGHVNFQAGSPGFSGTSDACLAIEEAGVEELARATTLGSTPWSTGVEYFFEFEYTATRLRIWVNGNLEFDITGSFSDGRLGFYNYSQAGVTYSALGVAAIGGFEGSPITIRGDFQDQGVLDTHTGTMYWADSSPLDALTIVETNGSGTLATPAHVYDDNGTFTGRACVLDDDGGLGCKQVTINISNLPPDVNAAGDTVAHGDPATVQVEFTDPGTEDVHSATIDWGDGSAEEDLGEQTSPFSAQHTFPGPGTYTVTVTVTDDDGGEGVATADVIVEEAVIISPLADAGGPYTVDEGSSVTLDGTGSSDPDGTIVLYEWDLDDDGVFAETGAGAANGDETGAAPVFDALLLDDPDPVEVSLRVTDNDGETSSAAATVNVLNVAPEPSATGDSIDEDSTATVSVSFTDPAAADMHTVTIDWGDGSAVEDSGSLTSPFDTTHTYDDNGTYTATVTVTDDDGGVGTTTATVEVSNVAPTASLGNDGPVDEGQQAIVTFSAQSDPSTADITTGFTYSFDFGNDGSFEVTGSSTPTELVPLSLTGDGPAVVEVLGRIGDKDGGFTDYVTVVTVNNVAPTPDAGGPYFVDEGGTVMLSGSATDPADALDPLTFEWDLDGDGIFSETELDAERGDETGVSPTFDASALDGPDSITISLRASDGDGGENTVTATVTVNNVAPSVTAGGDTVSEGSEATVSGSITDPAPADSFTVTIDWGDGSAVTVLALPAGSALYSATHPYVDDNPTATLSDDYVISITVEDDDGGSGTASATVTVNNLDPVVNAGPDITLNVGEALTLAPATFTDAGLEDTHTATIEWGDGNSDTGVVSDSGGSGTVAGSHSYSLPGTFTVRVSVTDDDGGFGQDTLTVTVLEIATRDGFMTGGGNIRTGIGKDAQHLSWGFTIRCDGSHANFQFNDHGSGNRFHLERVETVECWDQDGVDPGDPEADFDTIRLVGTGRWNGESGARIEVVIVDAGEPGANDTLEIRIWDASGALVETIPTVLDGGNHQAHHATKDETLI